MLNQILEAFSARRTAEMVAAVLLATLRLIPGLIVIVLSSLTFLMFPLVSESRQRGTLELVDRLIRWTVSGEFSLSQDNDPVT